MKVSWEVDYDGTRGSQRTHYTKVNDSDILDCGTFESAMRMIEEMVRDDFDAICRPTITSDVQGDIAVTMRSEARRVRKQRQEVDRG